jgi:ribosomal protein S1
MNMIETTPSPEFDYLFEEESNKFKTKEYQELDRLYEKSMSSITKFGAIPSKGDIITAEYMGISAEQHVFYVNGFKDDIIVENRPSEFKYLQNAQKGDIMDVIVTKVDNGTNFLIKGSILELYESRAHDALKSLEDGIPVMAKVKELNPAGYEMDLYHGGVTLKGFMPNTLAGVNKLSEPQSIVGNSFEVMVESYSKNEGTYIVSRRAYLYSLIPDAIAQLEHRTPYTGYVTGTKPFGIFVEFNECLTGMIHKANINPDWQNRIGDIKPGFEIDFYIKEVIKDKNNNFKIILTQVLRETLWDTIKNGQILDGVVKDTKAFGTLVRLDDETVGLIHTSEMEKIGKKFTTGQELKVKVLSLDRSSRKIFLTVG